MGNWQGIVLTGLMVVCLAGCEDLALPGVGATLSGADASSDADVKMIHDLGDAGRMYHNYIDTHGKGPSSWDDFRQFAPNDTAHQAVLGRLQAAGYQFVWNADLKSGVLMSETKLAQSPSQSAYLLLDGSIGGVSPELFERAQEARRSRASTGKSKSTPTVEVVNYPKPSTPMEQAVYDYLLVCERYIAALSKIQNLASAQQAKPAVRALDSQFDDAARRMAEQGIQVDFLAVPEKYKDAVRDIPLRLMNLENRLARLPDGDSINKLFLSDEGTLGPTGPRRAHETLQAEFLKRHGQSGSNTQASAPPPPPPPPPPGFAGRPGSSAPLARADRGSSVPRESGFAADSNAEPASASSPASESELRTWSDASGRFTIEAKFKSQEGSRVRLEKADGSEVVISLALLSPADRAFLRQRDEAPEEAAGPSPSSSAAFGERDRVEVESQSIWHPAIVLKAEGDRYFIHYENFSDHWDEWVGPDRIRSR